MRSLFIFCICFFSLLSFSALAADQDSLSNASFQNFSEEFLRQYFDANPSSGAFHGMDRYDPILPIPDKEQRLHDLAFCTVWLDSLKQFAKAPLGPSERTDYFLLKGMLESRQWYFSEFKSWEWWPSSGVGGRIDLILNRDKEMPKKARDLYELLSKIPAYFSQCRRNLTDPSFEHTKLTIQQLEGSRDLFSVKLAQFIEQLNTHNDPLSVMLQSKMPAMVKRASDAMENYRDHLQYKVVEVINTDPNRRDFRIGKEMYADKFKHDIAGQFTAAEIFDYGLKEKKSIHNKMQVITGQLWPQYFDTENPNPSLEDVGKLIAEVAENHVSREDYFEAIQNQISELEAFVSEKDLIWLDPEKPLKVRETPGYMRGIAGASISAPGPYEKMRPTFYNVTPLDHYSEEEAESYLREYNHYILQILNIHEAVPGHYTQLMYANESPSLIKSLFGNGTMIEGWACYVERMMLEEGYGNNAPEMWLMYYKWNLRELCNMLIDIGVHAEEMTQEDVMDILVNEAFQESAEAEGKWKRVQYTSVQLCSYYTGLIEILQLREDVKTDLGEDFSLKAFHEEFLSYGSAPVKYIRELMGY